MFIQAYSKDIIVSYKLHWKLLFDMQKKKKVEESGYNYHRDWQYEVSP